MTLTIVDEQDILTTPTGMAPISQAFFVVHAGHQTVLDAQNPLAREAIELEPNLSLDPIEEREFRVAFGTQVMEAIGTA